MKEIRVNKGEMLQRKGELNSKIYKVQSGILRSYSIDDKGKEHIFMFAPEDWTIAEAGFEEHSCELFIDAIEDSVVQVYDKVTGFEKRDFVKIRRRLQVLEKRTIMLMSFTAYERYEHFVKTYPNIVQRVPQKMIASYLGVTPEALSRAKKEILNS